MYCLGCLVAMGTLHFALPLYRYWTFPAAIVGIVPALVFPILMDRLFIRTEEAMLAESFGAEWQDYSASVRRWL